jgi:hypothetical protein
MKDLEAIAALCCAVTLIIAATLLFSAISQWLANVAYRAGLVSTAAQWTIYMMGLALCIGVVLTVAGRAVDGKWWFR